EDIDKFLEYYDGVIKEQNGDIYTLRITPKDKSVYYQQIWIEEVIDYVKGVEVKSLISGVDDTLITSTEFFDISQVDGIWFAKSKTIKTREENGNIITNIIKYEDIKINQSIADNLFEIEMP
ncbi:MAG: outer membrane lipoprotein-sorting protein, partial [Dehalococcoidales bacterium]|nr:outer membrane lipoprotein-sorting protein [Dehalococcoidales bacterium]